MSLIGDIFILDDVVKNRGCNHLNYPNVTEIYDLVYDRSNPDTCTTDLYFDKAQEPENGYPVLMNIHGGGWVVGDKKFRRGFSLQMADNGLFVVNINYALSPAQKYPTSIQNCFAALSWILQKKDEYHLNIDQLFISGDSAGAQMTAVVCAALTNPEYREKLNCPDIDAHPKGALLYCGIYDFENKLYRLPVSKVMLQSLTGLPIKKVNSYPHYPYLSPLSYITPAFPPTFVVSGKTDILTSNNHILILNALEKNNIPHEHYRGTDIFNSFHCFYLKVFMTDARKCMYVSRRFVRRLIEGDTIGRDEYKFLTRKQVDYKKFKKAKAQQNSGNLK